MPCISDDRKTLVTHCAKCGVKVKTEGLDKPTLCETCMSLFKIAEHVSQRQALEIEAKMRDSKKWQFWRRFMT